MPMSTTRPPSAGTAGIGWAAYGRALSECIGGTLAALSTPDRAHAQSGPRLGRRMPAVGAMGRFLLIACGVAFVGALLLVAAYFIRTPVPAGYDFPRHSWWGGGPAALLSGTLVEEGGCIRVQGAFGTDTVVWPARYSLRLRDGGLQVSGDGRTAHLGSTVALAGGEYGTADELESTTGETTRCPAPYWATTGWGDPAR